MGTIVVGVDHSSGAKAALRFALDEARLRHAALRVVHAWQLGYVGTPGIEASSTAFGAELDLRSGAQDALEESLRETIPDTDGVELERRVVEGAAASVLVDESRDADLLVVGSRGLGGFRGLLLGSVGQQCAHHAACPVVIVPHPQDA
jgi:nucleotide-binding universal stress UspA family protein